MSRSETLVPDKALYLVLETPSSNRINFLLTFFVWVLNSLPILMPKFEGQGGVLADIATEI